MINKSAHPLDHLVLPTRSLDAVRSRLASLGFVVAPTGVHPFGTENACAFFADGTYLEPLAIGNEQTADRAIGEGNVFVARDRLYRQTLGDEGFSAVVFATANADADHERYVEAGLSAGEMLSFSRAFADANGKSDTASFKLAFVSDKEADEAFLFACQRINAPKIDRTALQAHANGATGILEVIAISDRPPAQIGLIATAAGADASDGDAVRLPNAVLGVLSSEDYGSRFGLVAAPSAGLRFVAIVLSVRDKAAVMRLLAKNAIDHDMSGNDIVVAPAPGQGAAFIFREIP
ncbi:MAG: VOC family protein [Mesorhizobium sp.]|nr:VOC family protein [Mesorhizobium sp.]